MTRPAPYPAETRAKGWRFELDHERIEQSDTWALAPADVRPWLLMLWLTAWRQEPCGSLPNDDELIAAKIGMTLKTFVKVRAKLMRGWWLAEDGRLYHDTVSLRVTEMLAARDGERRRKAEYRERKDAERIAASRVSPEMSHGTTTGQPPDSTRNTTGRDDTGTGTGTSTYTQVNSVPIGTGGKPPPMTPDEIVFGYGVPMLTNAGSTDKAARSFLGSLRKGHGDDAVIKALRDCFKAKPLQPLEWLAAALPPGGSRPKLNAQEALEAANRAVGERFLAERRADA